MAEAYGSSPRVRGKHALGRCRDALSRLIPARAGKTCPSTRWCPACTAHPRACGENAANADTMSRAEGSSPRVRGKRRAGRAGAGVGGLIPARAGKTCPRCCGTPRTWAHPRACGENIEPKTMPNPALGSSPRVRGKLPRSTTQAACRGLIPARAGKTSSASPRQGAPGAHPRACGENPVAVDRLRRSPWLIPARAGKTARGRGWGRWCRAHPRACGENPDLDRVVAGTVGSSPRVRGKHHRRRRDPHRRRLIPARAGKTSSLSVELCP